LEVLRLRGAEQHVAGSAQHDLSLVRIAPRRRPERGNDHATHPVGVVGVRSALHDMAVENDDGAFLQLTRRHRTSKDKSVRLFFVRHDRKATDGYGPRAPADWPQGLPDPLLDADLHGVARLLADRLAQLRFDRQPVRVVACAMSAPSNGSPSISPRIFTSPRVPKSSAASSITTHVHAPGLSLLKLGVELSQHHA
jgi:hypothetical protein